MQQRLSGTETPGSCRVACPDKTVALTQISQLASVSYWARSQTLHRGHKVFHSTVRSIQRNIFTFTVFPNVPAPSFTISVAYIQNLLTQRFVRLYLLLYLNRDTLLFSGGCSVHALHLFHLVSRHHRDDDDVPGPVICRGKSSRLRLLLVRHHALWPLSIHLLLLRDACRW